MNRRYPETSIKPPHTPNTGGLSTPSTWSMGRTDGPNTASTGSMSSTCARVQAVPVVQKSKLRGVLRVSRVLIKILRVIL